ncbi:MAG: carbohydrate ABC transporter permease [Phycisphaerae bacterium]
MNRRRSEWRGYVFVAPATLYLLLFSFVPMVVAAWMSVHRWHLLKPDRPFVGLDNFTALAADPFFRNAAYNSFLFAALSVPLCVVTALLVALLVHQPLRAVGFFRTLYFVPAVSSQAALAMVWIWVFLPDSGLVNFVLRACGYAGQTDFLNDTSWALPALVLMSAWIGLGPRMVIFVAGLQSIPETLYEAANLDGAGAWRRFRYVTLPLLVPTTLFVVVTTTIAAFQFFTPIYMITKGGPRRTTDVVAYHIYKEAWMRFEVGLASAQSYVLFAMILAFALLQFHLLRRGMGEQEAPA